MSGIRLFVGLGNPSDNYQNTRHNIGFWWVDFITKNHRLPLKNSSKLNPVMLDTGSQVNIMSLNTLRQIGLSEEKIQRLNDNYNIKS